MNAPQALGVRVAKPSAAATTLSRRAVGGEVRRVRPGRLAERDVASSDSFPSHSKALRAASSAPHGGVIRPPDDIDEGIPGRDIEGHGAGISRRGLDLGAHPFVDVGMAVDKHRSCGAGGGT